MSDSEDGAPRPSDAQIASTLKQIVTRTYEADDLANLTVKRVRQAIEEALRLPANWLKEDEAWSAKSKALITAEVERLEAAGSEGDAPVAAKPQKKANGKAKAAAAAPKKRKAPGEPKKKAEKLKAKPRKKRKVSSDEEDEEDEAPVDDVVEEAVDEIMASAGEDETPSPVARKPVARAKEGAKARPRKKVVDSEDEDMDEDVKMADIASPAPTAPAAAPEAPAAPAEEPEKKDIDHESEENPTSAARPVLPQPDGNDSESSLSSLLDEPPARKKRQKKVPAPKATKSKAKTASKPAAKKDAKEITPDDEEIKRLQGWLLKCGIRKVWGKELKPFETPKAKIAHLKGMLSDAGMTGRFSVEKARQIKEQRELAADLEAVTAFDDRWGTKEDESRPKRRGDMARDLGLDPSLLDDSDDED